MIKEITIQTCSVYRQVRNADSWTSVNVLSEQTGLVPRTVRSILTKLEGAGVVESYKVHGGFRYRIRKVIDNEAKQLIARLHSAEKVFGLTEGA